MVTNNHNDKGNAHLISAAPDLLHACQLLMRAESMRMLSSMQQGARDGCTMGEISQAIDAAREAIKKATAV